MTNEVVKYEEVKDRIITLRGVPVLLDADVAQLYGVETKRVNEAVKNNPDKFPEGFLFKLDKHELAELRSKISTSSSQAADNKEIAGLQSNLLMAGWGGARKMPTAFTESGLYMLATILKSPRAIQTTIAIIKTIVQLRELARNMQAVAATEDEAEKKTLLQKSGELINNVIGTQFETVGTETEVELNFAMVKIRHKVIRGNKGENIEKQ